MEPLLCITSFSFVLYTLFLITLVRFPNKDPINSAFFRLCIPLGVVDLLSIVNFYLFLKFPDREWYDADLLRNGQYSHLMAKLGLHGVYIFGYWQTFGVLFLAINRFTVFVFPMTHELVWEKWLKWAVIAQIVTPWILVSPQIVLTQDAGDIFYYCFNGTDSCFIVFADKQLENLLLIIANISVAFIAVVIGVLYAYMFYAAYKKQNTNISPSTHASYHYVLKMGFCGFSTFISMACFSWSCFHLGTSENKHVALQILYVIRDVCAWSNPYIIITCSKMVRKALFKTLFCQSTNLEQTWQPQPAVKETKNPTIMVEAVHPNMVSNGGQH